jgi:alpha-beta hydrolase superfamily lysophospholipase
MHGLESSPQGNKARYLARHFEAHTPAMDTGDFQACYEQQAREVAAFRPDVVVGSSFGGALAVLLLVRGAWAGPTLLLAQASARFDTTLALPEGVPVLLVHGTRDDVIDIEGSRRLARTGTPGLVRLVEVDDGHRLDSLVETDRLADLVREVGGRRQRA